MASISDFIGEARAGGWKPLTGAFLGSALSVSAVPFFTLGVFVEPLSQEFGWSKPEVQFSLTMSMLGMITAAIPIGWLADKLGARKIAIVGMVVHALVLALLSMAGPNLYIWYAMWFTMAFLASGSTAMTWTRGVSDWFSKSRGLALGIALMGNGVTGIIAPPVVTSLIQDYGWREAMMTLSVAVVILGVLPTVLLFRERPREKTETPKPLAGLSLKEALGGYKLWAIFIAFVLLSFGVAGSIPNLFALLMDRNYTPMQAASLMSLIGVSVIVGRIGAGWLLDRFWAPAVAFGLLVLPIVGCLALAFPGTGVWMVALAILAIGLTAGMEFDLLAYLVSRYFGFRHYGKVFAAPWIGFALGAAFGAAIFAQVREMTGSYTLIMLIASGTFLISALLFLTLGKYPDFGAEEGKELPKH